MKLQCNPLDNTLIVSFRHKGLERFFSASNHRGIPGRYSTRIERMLDKLDACRRPDDMNMPGYKFHSLKGDRKGRFAVTVSGNLRITFGFDGEQAINVDLEDYH
jgi:proteic killer suppression protein